ncbi:hypothetical protein C7974DRAFT_392365 [Boeremia exigua]|uniref:uncharacterized protein n=1 Tax=Boeremia exigua TaxID=749465 RepID=UPI001E8DF1B4|nr:uncharacterized protein C7974DRAFT_392365 [Boeremia exigua]KAH6633210.1 hypothetical protein C7974DRAFT_392365 [Boeremia exigua]
MMMYCLTEGWPILIPLTASSWVCANRETLELDALVPHFTHTADDDPRYIPPRFRLSGNRSCCVPASESLGICH